MPGLGNKENQAAAKESPSRGASQRTVHTRSASAAVPTPVSQQRANSRYTTVDDPEDQRTRSIMPAAPEYPEPDRYREHRLHSWKYKEAQEAECICGGRALPTVDEMQGCTSKGEAIQKMESVWRYTKAIILERAERVSHSKRFLLKSDVGYKTRIKVLDEEIEKAHRAIEILGERALKLHNEKLCSEAERALCTPGSGRMSWRPLTQVTMAPAGPRTLEYSVPVMVPTPPSQQPAAPLCNTLQEDERTRCGRPATSGCPDTDRCREHHTQYRLHYRKYKEAQEEAERVRGGRAMPTVDEMEGCTSKAEAIQKMEWVWRYTKAIIVERTERVSHSKRFFLESDFGHRARIEVLEEEIEKAQQVIEKLGEQNLRIEEHLKAERADMLQSHRRKNTQPQSPPSLTQAAMPPADRRTSEQSAPTTLPAPTSQQPSAPRCNTLEEDERTRCRRPADSGYHRPNLCTEHHNQYLLQRMKYKEAREAATRIRDGREIPTEREIAECTGRAETIKTLEWVWKYTKALIVERTEREIHSERFLLGSDDVHKHRNEVLERRIEKAQQAIENLGERILRIKEHHRAELATILQNHGRRTAQAQSQPYTTEKVIASASRRASTSVKNTTRVDGNSGILEPTTVEDPPYRCDVASPPCPNIIVAVVKADTSQESLAEKRCDLEQLKKSRESFELAVKRIEEIAAHHVSEIAESKVSAAIERVGQENPFSQLIPMPVYPGLLGVWDYARDVRRALSLRVWSHISTGNTVEIAWK